MMELLGRQAEAEFRTLRLEAETGDPPAMTQMETGRPVVSPPHRWWAKCEQRSCRVERIVRVAGDVGDFQEKSSTTLERSILEQQEEVFRAG
ncbi:Ubiquinone/menaquinone biosynthesis C-methyltransferase UbiE [Labeo rohita]|uniref:Ubiquinone/menaquinone biosynthesis C-methyltransferase UbiE n=1 Tax=Labeo rohita TaxID=84645 RepID=A0ABQ8M845_LABRO|nr:Ubiquinone/menaquinone biosynthesis C-methyltransferase UbiE [Labeo rohita]